MIPLSVNIIFWLCNTILKNVEWKGASKKWVLPLVFPLNLTAVVQSWGWERWQLPHPHHWNEKDKCVYSIMYLTGKLALNYTIQFPVLIGILESIMVKDIPLQNSRWARQGSECGLDLIRWIIFTLWRGRRNTWNVNERNFLPVSVAK